MSSGVLFTIEAGEKPGKAMKIAFRTNKADDGDECLRVYQLLEGNIVQVELSGDGDHHTIQPLFMQSPVGPHAKLASQHHVESMWPGTATFVTQLNAGAFASDASLFFEFCGNAFGDHFTKIAVGHGQVTMIVPGHGGDDIV